MKVKYIALCFMLQLMLACSPKNEEVQDEHVEVQQPEEVADSATNTRKDAVMTDENDTSPTLPLPQPVLQIIAQKYPDFKQPTLTEEARERASNFEQGPTLVRGDFNGDNQQDYALQLQQDEDVVIVSAISNSDSTWQLNELKRDILFNERGTLKTLYYLYLVEKGAEIYNSETNTSFEAPHDALAVGIEKNSTAFVYENNKFRAYTYSNEQLK